MAIKISQFSPISAVASNTILAVVDPAGPTSFNATATQLQTFILSGNAATVTNGVYTTDVGTVTNTMLAGSIANNKLSNSAITINGVSISLGGSGTVTAELPVATSLILGGVKIGSGISVALDGTITVDTDVIATKTYVDNTSTDNAISFSVALG